MVHRLDRQFIAIAVAFCCFLLLLFTDPVFVQGNPVTAPTVKSAADESFFEDVFSGGVMIVLILAFREVALSQGTAGAGDLASGIYSALVTTVCGLVIAIPSLAAFAIFRNKNRRNHFGHGLFGPARL